MKMMQFFTCFSNTMDSDFAGESYWLRRARSPQSPLPKILRYQRFFPVVCPQLIVGAVEEQWRKRSMSIFLENASGSFRRYHIKSQSYEEGGSVEVTRCFEFLLY